MNSPTKRRCSPWSSSDAFSQKGNFAVTIRNDWSLPSKIFLFVEGDVVELIVVHASCNWDKGVLSLIHSAVTHCWWHDIWPCLPCHTWISLSWQRTSKVINIFRLSKQINRSSVMWRPPKPLFSILNWPIEIFSFSLWSVIIVFTCHHLKVRSEILLDNFSYHPLWRFWIHRWSSFPIIFWHMVKEMIVLNATRWCFVYILKLISILALPWMLVKILFI